MSMNYKHWTDNLQGGNESEQDAIDLLLGYLLADNPSLRHSLEGWIKEGRAGPRSKAGQCIKRIVAHARNATT